MRRPAAPVVLAAGVHPAQASLAVQHPGDRRPLAGPEIQPPGLHQRPVGIHRHREAGAQGPGVAPGLVVGHRARRLGVVHAQHLNAARAQFAVQRLQRRHRRGAERTAIGEIANDHHLPPQRSHRARLAVQPAQRGQRRGGLAHQPLGSASPPRLMGPPDQPAAGRGHQQRTQRRPGRQHVSHRPGAGDRSPPARTTSRRSAR